MAWRRKFKVHTIVRKSPNSWISDNESKTRDCYGVFERSARIWRTAGIFPLTLERPTGIAKYQLNKFCAVYSALVCCACIGNIVYMLGVFANWTRHGEDVVEPEDIETPQFTTLLCVIIATIWRIFCHKEISGIVNTMAGLDLSLEKMNCSMRYKSDTGIISTFVWGSLVSTTLLLIYDFNASNPVNGSITIWRLLASVPLIIQTLDQTMFASLVGLLGLKFRVLNEKLIAVVMRTNLSPPKIIVTSDDCAENLRTIAKTHYSMCAVGKRINRFFAWEMIINVITNFTTLNKSLFSIFIEVDGEGSSDLVLIGMYVEQGLISVVPIIIIVAICNWTSQQSAVTGKFIHQTRVDKIESRLYATVKTFSLQLHHQKLEFTAAGFFPVNSRLIQQMIAQITAYMVFLIQVKTSLENMRGSEEKFENTSESALNQ